MAIVDTISSMYENVGEVYDTITNVDVNNGKNLFKGTLNNGIINQGGTYISNPNRITNADSSTMKTFILKKGTYTLSIENIDTCTIVIKNESGSVIQEFADSWKTLPYTFTTTNDGYFYFSAKKNIDSALTPSDYKPMLEKGSSATEYQPYTDNPTYKNIENIPSTIRKSYLDIMNNGIDTIYDNWEKVNGTGTSISLNNTEEAPMTIEYKGNTSQETTTGQNLLPNNQTTQTINGVTFTMNSDKSVTIKGTATTNTDYYFVGTSSEYEDFGLTTGTYNLNGCTGGSEQTYMLFTVMNRNGNIYYYNNTYAGGRSMIVETGDKFRIFIRVISGKNVNTTIYPQINVGSTALPYEPYTNGATPRPTYPQDIHIVSGDNSIKVEGKNLIPLSDIISTSGTTSNGITFTLQEDGTIKANGTATGGISIYLTTNYIEQKAGTYTFSDGISSGQSGTTFFLYADVRHLDGTSWDTKNFSTAETTTRTRTIEEAFKFKPRIVIRQGQVLNNLIFKPMLEKGSTATTYEEYKGASYPIYLGVENLFDKDNANYVNGWIDGTTMRLNTINGNRMFYIPCKPNTTYTISRSVITSSFRTITYNSTPFPTVTGSNVDYTVGSVLKNDNGTTLTITTNANAKYLVVHYGKIEDTNLNESLATIQVEYGSKQNSYTTYGTTPIELCKIGTYQDRIFKSSGKNLFDDIVRQGVTTYDGGVYSYNATRLTSTNWITLKAGTYTINAKTNTSKTLQVSNITFDTNDNFYNISGVSGIWKTLPFTFTTPIDIKWKYNFDYSDNSNITVNEINSIILNKGTTALPYEPYGKDWYLNKQIGKVVLDGSENWNADAGTQGTDYRHNILRSRLDIPNPIGINGTYMSNYFRQHTMNNDSGFFGEFYCNSNWFIFLDKEKQYLIEGWKDWLSTHNTTIYYVLATPTYEKITGELLNQLEAIKNSYENQTNINQENNDLPFELEVGALEKY